MTAHHVGLLMKSYALIPVGTALVLTLLTACGHSGGDHATSANADIHANEQLGTTWGDEIRSPSKHVSVTYLSDDPIDQNVVRYAAKAFTGKTLNSVSLHHGKVNLSFTDDNGNTLPITRENSDYYLSATEGQKYTLRYTNTSDNTYAIIASVDGLNVITGERASVHGSSYILNPHATLLIEGFRKNDSAVAGFTFGKPEQSYANHLDNGSIDNTGVIGTAIYEVRLDDESTPKFAPPPNSKPNTQPQAFPADK